jgi:hypothetical protein
MAWSFHAGVSLERAAAGKLEKGKIGEPGKCQVSVWRGAHIAREFKLTAMSEISNTGCGGLT